MAIGDFSSGHLMNKTNDCLVIGSYICGLNSEFFLHTDKNRSFFLLETCILTLYLFMFALNLFLHRFRNELTRSLTNGNHFSSTLMTNYIAITIMTIGYNTNVSRNKWMNYL